MKKAEVNLEISEDDLTGIAALGIREEEAGDIEKAIILYKFGVYFEDVACTIRLADLLSEPPIFRDVKTAESLYRKACVAGEPIGCHNLAILYKALGRTKLYNKYMALAKARGIPEEAQD